MIQEGKIRKVLQPAVTRGLTKDLMDLETSIVVLLPGSTMSPETRFYFTLQNNCVKWIAMSCELTTFSTSSAEQVVLNRGLFHLQACTPEAEVSQFLLTCRVELIFSFFLFTNTLWKW